MNREIWARIIETFVSALLLFVVTFAIASWISV